MRAQVVITLDGRVSVITRQGTFEDGKAAIERLLADLKAQEIDVELSGPVEQHRHDDPPQVRGRVPSN